MRKLSIITSIIAIALVGIYYLIGSFIPGPRVMGAQDMSVDVIVTGVKLQPVTIYKELPARIRSTKTSEVRPQLSGIILKQNFTEGSFVKKGQALYQIDPSPYSIEVNQAKSEVEASQVDLKAKKDNLDRYKTLFEAKAVSKAELDSVAILFEKSKADLAIKNAGLDKAKIRLNYTKVLAPIDGKIGKSYVTQGALVKDMQDSPLAIITDLDSVYADISQPSTQIKEIQDALMSNEKIEVELFSPDEKKKPLNKGILQFSDSIIEESTGSVLMRAKFDNKDHKLLPGLFVQAKLNLGTKDVLTIDQSAVIINPDGTMMVYLVGDNNVANPKIIEIDGRYKNYWIVKSGLKRGDLVVKEGLQKIGPGSKINPSLPNEEIINMTDKIDESVDDDTKIGALDKDLDVKSTLSKDESQTEIVEEVSLNDNIKREETSVDSKNITKNLDITTKLNGTNTLSESENKTSSTNKKSEVASDEAKKDEAKIKLESDEKYKKVNLQNNEKLNTKLNISKKESKPESLEKIRKINENIVILEEKPVENSNEAYKAKIDEFIHSKLLEAQKNILSDKFGDNKSRPQEKPDKNVKNSNISSNSEILSAKNIKKQEG